MKPAGSSVQEMPRDSSADRARVDAMPPRSRSRIANGHLGFDMRTRAGRRWRDVFADAMQRAGNRCEQLAKAYASAVLAREALDARIAAGQDVDVALLVKLSGEVRRLSARLDLAGDPALVPHDAPAFVIGPREAAP